MSGSHSLSLLPGREDRGETAETVPGNSEQAAWNEATTFGKAEPGWLERVRGLCTELTSKLRSMFERESFWPLIPWEMQESWVNSFYLQIGKLRDGVVT